MNACKPPLQWQTYDVTFHKARVEDGKVVKKARVTVIQNGIKIIDDAEISITPGGIGVAGGPGRPAPAPGPRQPRRVSEYLDQAARMTTASAADRMGGLPRRGHEVIEGRRPSIG